MSIYIRQICVFSVFCTVASTLAPKGQIKKIISLLSTCAIILMVISPLRDMDLSSYALEMSKYRDKSSEIYSKAEQADKNLNRLIIEEKYETYILDKAEKLGTQLSAVKVTVRWNTDGCWVPESVKLYAAQPDASLAAAIEAELGITEKDQEWCADE